jgi:hypothetical protein
VVSQAGPPAARIRSRWRRSSTRAVIFPRTQRLSHPRALPSADVAARGISRVLITLDAVVSSKATPAAKPSHRIMANPRRTVPG